ncbi:MAG: glycosyltransferase family 2 protein [Rhizobiaceae bacterium]
MSGLYGNMPPKRGSVASAVQLGSRVQPPLDEDGSSCVPLQLGNDISFLLKFGVSRDCLETVEQRAVELGLPPAKVLLDGGLVSQDRYFRLLAMELGLEFCETVPDGVPVLPRLPAPDEWSRMARIAAYSPQCCNSFLNSKQADYYIAPDVHQLHGLRKLLLRSPHYAQRLKIMTHASGLNHLVRRASFELLYRAQNGLHLQHSHLSAKRVATIGQALFLLLTAQTLVLLGYVAFEPVLMAFHLPALLGYFAHAGLRFLGWVRPINQQDVSATPRIQDAQLPVYSVLVALHDEANQVDKLVAALLRLDWPKERLEIKLICEADDLQTIAACQHVLGQKYGSILSVVVVPVGWPRTKPKALNFALPLCSGDCVVVYDAEDRPDPAQLREAFTAFAVGPTNLACLQSPLSIHNAADGWLPSMFAIDYSAHFDGFLPVLERFRLPIPLGGSSNHFKRQALVNIGAWDPYNVTEDADLGIRLSRAGCVAGTLKRPTYEEAPNTWRVWLRQRTRWFKGWYQTWLVHMRHPIQLLSELGMVKFLAFQMLSIGTALAALVYPFWVYFLATCLVEIIDGHAPTWKHILAWVDMTAILFCFLAWGLLAAKTLPIRNLQHLRLSLLSIPVYWTLLSVAAWRAIWQLIRSPHVWEKTPHGASLSQAAMRNPR